MSATAFSGEAVSRSAKRAIVGIFVAGAIAASVWAIVFGITNWQRGIYAGMHGNDAEQSMKNALIVQYGKTFASTLRFAKPMEVKTHLNNVVTGTGQVRIFHLIGRRGVHYCVDVWGPGTTYWSKPDKNGDQIDIGAQTLIRKGCSFKVTA